jgi:hypothetical protein
VRRTLPLENSQKKKREREEKVQTLPSGRTFFLGSG